uniref:K Homology domain-containing protein n=1 Tax=Gopherus agassizii TaxID=38772 RepID=A0A452IXN8_9SAUR
MPLGVERRILKSSHRPHESPWYTFNFVGKLLGPRGNSLKRLQEETGAKMSILGKGSMRDKAKEEELRKSGEAKYSHLSDELHVLIEVFAPPGEAYSRMSHALEEIKKFLVPDYNDEIRQEQLRELSYLNGSEDSARGRGIRGRGIRVTPAAPSRGRGGALPPPQPGRGAQTPRGTPVTRGALPVPPIARGVPTPRARGTPAVPGYRPPPPPAHEAYEEYVSNYIIHIGEFSSLQYLIGQCICPSSSCAFWLGYEGQHIVSTKRSSTKSEQLHSLSSTVTGPPFPSSSQLWLQVAAYLCQQPHLWTPL